MIDNPAEMAIGTDFHKKRVEACLLISWSKMPRNTNGPANWPGRRCHSKENDVPNAKRRVASGSMPVLNALFHHGHPVRQGVAMAAHRTEARQDPWPDVLAAIRVLRKGHKDRHRIRKTVGQRGAWGRRRIREVGEQLGYGEATARNWKRFADLYSQEELNSLCDLCRDDRRALGLWSVFKFVTIQNHRSRAAFAKEAIAGRWSYTRIERELRCRFPRESRPRGRKPKLPESEGEALLQIAEMSQGFVRWAALVDQEREKTWLPKRVVEDMAQAVAALEALQASASKSLAQSQANQTAKPRRNRRRSRTA
jgi:hypothetical protein